MKELRDIIKAFDTVIANDSQAVLASVIHTSGSTYRSAGAKALILADDNIIGVVSGGCLESDLIQRAGQVRDSGQSITIRYDHSENADIIWGLGLGCAGVVDVLLERVDKDNPGPLTLIAEVIKTRTSAIMATIISSENSSFKVGERWRQNGTGSVSFTDAWPFPASLNDCLIRSVEKQNGAIITEQGAEVLIEQINPLTRLLVFGAGADAVPLVTIGAEIGWYLEVFDKRSAYASTARFPLADRLVCCSSNQLSEQITIDEHTIAIVMTHNYLQDLEILKFLLPHIKHYIGVLGPQRRLALLLKDLADEKIQVSDAQKAILYGPAGLDIGADTAEEIALSIVSEIQTVLRNRSGGLLRDRGKPIHSENAEKPTLPNIAAVKS